MPKMTFQNQLSTTDTNVTILLNSNVILWREQFTVWLSVREKILNKRRTTLFLSLSVGSKWAVGGDGKPWSIHFHTPYGNSVVCSEEVGSNIDLDHMCFSELQTQQCRAATWHTPYGHLFCVRGFYKQDPPTHTCLHAIQDLEGLLFWITLLIHTLVSFISGS